MFVKVRFIVHIIYYNGLVREAKYMKLILIIIFVLIILKPSSNNDSGSRGRSGDTLKRKKTGVDPADTFYLEDGFDHETDDGYCDECDDYHDFS